MTAHERIEAAIAARDKATPGPWDVMENGFGKISGGFPTVYVEDDELRYIAKCADRVNIRTTNNNANAVLIAAAPDLVDEVIRLRKWQQEALPYLHKEIEQCKNVLGIGICECEEYTAARIRGKQLNRLIAEAQEVKNA